ncbi:hypothetical protein D3C85_1414240 [compost metagenome]
MRRHRCAGREQFLQQHEAREAAAPTAAILRGQRQADPAFARKGTAEVGIEAEPGARTHIGRHVAKRFFQERAHRNAQGFILGRNRGEGRGREDGIQSVTTWQQACGVHAGAHNLRRHGATRPIPGSDGAIHGVYGALPLPRRSFSFFFLSALPHRWSFANSSSCSCSQKR